MSKEKLMDFLSRNKLFEQHLRFHDFNISTHTAIDAAKILGVTTGQIIKSIVVMMGETPYLVILAGDRKMRQRAIRRTIAEYYHNTAHDSRLANPDEVIKFTGYVVGGVPPVGIDIPVIIDKPIISKKVVYAGGGTANTILELPVKVLLGYTQSIIVDIGKNIEDAKE